ncbi:MAG: class I SAM-dependent RNA methyltransferase [Actinomycetales bacterium]|nr:class I SAM-dependent RNA methyltransferase [Actinomycetales bacterium]
MADDSRDRFWRADTLRVLDPSPHRRPHVWPEAGLERDPAERPGGAEFGHIDPAHQRELKAAVLTEALERMASLHREVEVEALPGPADGTGWRIRVRLHVADDGSVGPYAARSHRVVPVASLPLAVEEVRELAPLGQAFPELAGSGSARRRRGEAADRARAVDVIAPSGGSARLVLGRQDPTAIVEKVGEREFRVDDTGFWQVHRHAAATLSAAVVDAIDPERFDPGAGNLDLYGGVGLFAAALGDRFGRATRVTSVEADERATEHAAENLADWVGARTVTAKVEQWVRGLGALPGPERDRLAAGSVVLDPPRSGAGREVLVALAAVAPRQIVYVACDPVALARDIGTLEELGYRLETLRAFDLFPATHHVEAVARLAPARES